MPIYDYQCTDPNCPNHSMPFEEFAHTSNEDILCPICNADATKVAFSIAMVMPMSPKYVDMHRKAELIRKRMSGELPWRKHSESQSD